MRPILLLALAATAALATPQTPPTIPPTEWCKKPGKICEITRILPGGDIKECRIEEGTCGGSCYRDVAPVLQGFCKGSSSGMCESGEKQIWSVGQLTGCFDRAVPNGYGCQCQDFGSPGAGNSVNGYRKVSTCK